MGVSSVKGQIDNARGCERWRDGRGVRFSARRYFDRKICFIAGSHSRWSLRGHFIRFWGGFVCLSLSMVFYLFFQISLSIDAKFKFACIEPKRMARTSEIFLFNGHNLNVYFRKKIFSKNRFFSYYFHIYLFLFLKNPLRPNLTTMLHLFSRTWRIARRAIWLQPRK